MRKSWWRVPLYCVIASWICFQLEIRLIARFAVVKSADGVISANGTIAMLIQGLCFLTVVAVGGLLFFRKMTRRELFFSASALVILNIVGGLIAYKAQGMAALYWAEFTEWDIFVSQLLTKAGLSIWVSAVITWIFPPYIFVLFGKKNTED